MNKTLTSAALTALLLTASGTASADFGAGLKAGTLGIGIEGRWSPIPWFDVRIGANQYDYDDSGNQAGIAYDATLQLDTYFLTGNFRFPLSPFRVTAGAFANGNELNMINQDTGGPDIVVGSNSFSRSDIGVLSSTTSFDDAAPYIGVGYDFEVFGKAGINFDFGLLWQGEPSVSLDASGLATASPQLRDEIAAALEEERLELEDDMNDFKAWPVVSLSFVYNF